MKLIQLGYGVLISPGQPGEFLALDGHGGRFFSDDRKKALEFKNRMIANKLKGKVVAIRVTYEQL